MHVDFAHAIASASAILATMLVMQRLGWWVPRKDGGPRFSWQLFVGIAAVLFALNVVWPAGGPT